MGTTRQEISEWFDEGVKRGASHMLVVCDTFDWEDYPVYVKPGENVREKYVEYSRDMQKVMEVYDLSMDKNTQMSEHRAMHLPS